MRCHCAGEGFEGRESRLGAGHVYGFALAALHRRKHSELQAI